MVPVNVSGIGHLPPGHVGVAVHRRHINPAARFGNDLETANNSVKRPLREHLSNYVHRT